MSSTAVDDLIESVAEMTAALGMPVPSDRGAKMRSQHHRHIEIRDLLAEGKSDDEIAVALGVSVELVRSDITCIKKLESERAGRLTDLKVPESGDRLASQEGGGEGSRGVLARPPRFPPETPVEVKGGG